MATKKVLIGHVKGDPGKDATVNGQNVVTISGKDIITVTTNGGTVTISAVTDGAGAHNATYRGKQLGTAAPTEAQYAAIADGSFTDLFIGDYWTINSVNYRIAAFDYWLHCGDTETTAHHVVLVPDTSLMTSKMYEANETTGGYVGSLMYTDTIPKVNAIIEAAFPGHILKHNENLSNAVTNGRITGVPWRADREADLISEKEVYGTNIFTPMSDGPDVVQNYTISKTQFPLFAMRPDLITIRNTSWWLRDPASASGFAVVSYSGSAAWGSASNVYGVRPAFAIR